MNLDRLLLEAKGDSNNNESIAFRISSEQKHDLLRVCDDKGLSLGRLMRALVSDFLEQVDA